MAKDKVFGAKVSNGKQFIAPGKSWLDYYYEDQDKRKKEAEEGKVRYVEAAKASRIQYSLPQYAGKSQNQGKTYQWERDLMQNEKIKGAGNSYTKKFDALTASMGMTEGQASEFRKYLDFQEDSKHVKPKKNKDGSLNKSQYLKYARDAKFQTDVMDDTFKNMAKTNKARSDRDRQVPFEKVTGWDKFQNMIGIELSDEQKNTLEAKELGVEPHFGGKKDKTDPVLKTRWAELQDTKEREDAEKAANAPKEESKLNVQFGIPIPGMSPQEPKTDYSEANAAIQAMQNNPSGKYDEANAAIRAMQENPSVDINNPKERDFLDDILAMAGVGLKGAIKKQAPISESVQLAADYVASGEKPNAATEELARGITRAANTAGFGVIKERAKDLGDEQYLNQVFNQREGGEKAADFVYDGLGYLPAGVKGYQALNSTKLGKFLGDLGKQGVNPRIMAEAVKGLTVGAGLATGEVGVKEIINPENQDYHDNQDYVGQMAALGAVADPALYGLGAGAKAGAQNVLGRMAKVDGELPSFNGQASDNILDSLAPQSTGTSQATSGSLYESLIRQANPGVKEAGEAITNAQAQKQQLEDAFVRQNLYEPKGPNPNHISGVKGLEDNIREQFNRTPQARQVDDLIAQLTGQREAAINAPQSQPPVINDWRANVQEPSPVSMENIAPRTDVPINNWQDNIVKNSQAPEEVLDSLARSETNPANDELIQAINAEAQATNQTPEEVIDTLVQTVAKESPEQVDDLLMRLDGTMNRPKPETEAISPAPASGDNAAGDSFDPLVRLNIQQHAPNGNGPKLISDGPVGSTKAITESDKVLSLKGKGDNFYEKYVNSNHSAKVAEVKVLENAIKKLEKDAATDAAKAKPKTVAKLKQQLKNVKKYGSDFEKAVGNEAAAAAASSNFLKNHFKALNSTVKNNEEMAQFLNYQMAMDLNWRRNNGLGTYELPEGVDWGDINALVQEATNNTKFGAFNSEMRNLTQEWRDVMLEHGLINKEAHAALSKNPHYMYLGKDLTHQQNNIQRGTNYRKTSDKRASGPNIVHSQTKGDAKSLFQNPIDNLINNTFSVYKNAYKEETGRQALRLAKLDKDKQFAWEITKKQYEKNGGIKVSNGGKPRYVALQDDLMDMIKENDAGLDMNTLTNLTSAFAGLKTRSLEYQTAALIRDTGTSMVTSQINNPLRYFKEYAKSLKNGSKDAKKIGGYFDKAHNAQTAGLDPEKVLKEFQRKQGNVKSFNLNNKKDWKELASTVGRIMDTPFKYTSKLLGQVSDEIPRDIEVRETERLFMKKHGKKIEAIQNRLAQVDEQLRAAEGATDPFDPALQGIDKLKGQKDKLENMLGDINRDLKREQIYRSRDVINYSRGGRGDWAKRIRKYIIFANTTTQSKDKMIRSFIERPIPTMLKAATAMAPLVAAQKVMWDKLDGEDKEVYERVPAYIKLNNFVFVDKGNVYTVPKIQELALVTNPIEAVLHGEQMNDVAKHTLKEAVPYQAGNIAAGLVPDERDGLTLLDSDPFTKNMPGLTIPTNVTTPLTDIVFNDKSGFNRKPISFYSDKANPWTAGVLKKAVGNNVNADRVDYLIRQYLGDYGKYGVYGADATVDPSNGDKLDELIRNINPLQDRIYRNDSKWFKAPILDKKKE